MANRQLVLPAHGPPVNTTLGTITKKSLTQRRKERKEKPKNKPAISYYALFLYLLISLCALCAFA
jgi:hypothetical protein